MNPYTPITKEIIKIKGKSKLSDVYIYACLYSTRNFKTGISKWNQVTISEKFNIPESTLQDSIQRLLKQNYILRIIRKMYRNGNEYIRKNHYQMSNNLIDFFFIRNDFFKLDIDRDIKGFVLLLKAICYNNIYLTERQMRGSINDSEIARKLDLDRGTVRKYIKLAIDNELIEIVGKNIVIMNDCFRLRVSDKDRRSEIVSTIQDMCNKYNAVMPSMNEKEINQIYMKYYFSESEIKESDDTTVIERYSLKYALENRIKSLPKEFNIEYIFKILKIPKPPIKERKHFELRIV